MRRAIAYALTNLLFGSPALSQGLHDRDSILCGFRYEQERGGRTSDASCAGEPERVFSTIAEPHPRNVHCSQPRDPIYFDWDGFSINLKTRTVSWVEFFGTLEHAKEDEIIREMKRGLTRDEASAKVDKGDAQRRSFPIIHIHKSFDPDFSRGIMQPDFKPSLHVLFGDKENTFTAYVSGVTWDAIVAQFITASKTSWVRLRFGKCHR